jgi:hypothetical protein
MTNNTQSNEWLAELDFDDAVERAETALTTFPGHVSSDKDYLRNDGEFILKILERNDPVYNVVAPRRFGKSSFLQRILRHAESRDYRVCYCDFLNGIESVKQQLQDSFNAQDSSLLALQKAISKTNDQPFVLLDEGNRLMHQDDEEGEEFRNLLQRLGKIAVYDKKIILCIAETKAFFNACSKRGEGLENLIVLTSLKKSALFQLRFNCSGKSIKISQIMDHKRYPLKIYGINLMMHGMIIFYWFWAP